MHSERKFFEEKFNVTETDLESYLGEALSAGGEYADLYFEYRVSSSISLDESLIKGATQGVSAGVGVRVIAGERSGYAYSDDLSPEKIRKAARIAAQIAHGPARTAIVGLSELQLARNLYPVIVAPTDVDLAAKLDLAIRAD
jgi:TldD protein